MIQKFNSFNESTQDEDNGMMSDEEVKEEVIEYVTKLMNTANAWSSRDTLRHFTDWEFWSGQSMVIIDIEIARQICKELLQYINEYKPGHPNIEEVYKALYKY